MVAGSSTRSVASSPELSSPSRYSSNHLESWSVLPGCTHRALALLSLHILPSILVAP